MKIALSLDQMAPRGGPKFILNLGQSLVVAGHEVTVMVETPGVWWPELAARGLRGSCLPRTPSGSFVRQTQQVAAAWNRQRFDVIVVNVSRPNRLALYASHLVTDNTAVLFVLHGDWADIYEGASRHVQAWNCAVGVSPQVYAGAARRFPHKPVFAIPNGVELPDAAQQQARLGWDLPLRLLFVGTLQDAHKGVFRLPAILAGCRARHLPVTLTVIGEGEDGPRLAQRFNEAGVADLVTMNGRQPPAAIATAMRTHHLLLAPTNMEGMPLVVLEAQANGCVAITTALPGITDVAIVDGVTGRLVEAGNIEQFVDQIAAMLAPDVWLSHSQAAIVHTRQHFSVEGMGLQYERLLTRLAQGVYPLKRPYHQSHKLTAVPFTRQDYLPSCALRLLDSPMLRRLRREKQRWAQIIALPVGGKQPDNAQAGEALDYAHP